jgi:DNA-binding NtrC family response regulator
MADKILLMDDNPGSLSVTAGILKFEVKNCRVVQAHNIATARAELAAEKFDLHILDGDVARLSDGKQLAEELVQQGKLVLVYSGSDANQVAGAHFLHRNEYARLPEVVKKLLGRLADI